MDSAPVPRAAPEEHFHPLEMIPAFRRIRRSAARDFAYTFIWNGLFGVTFMLVNMMTSGRTPSWHSVGLYFLIANLVGYPIHFLFILGSRSGIERAARGSGFAAKVLYYTVVPMLGVLAGFFLASFVVDTGFRDIFRNASALLSIVTSSLVISIVLSAVFFWRERSAKAEAMLALERARVERIEREAALANLRALQAQIEPHFLFNTLANVTSLIDPDPAKAKRMLESFNLFLRSSLAATRNETTTLGEEATLIAAYLDVLQVRMGSRLAYAVDVPAALASFPIAPMLLQPVVENAIKHGLEPKIDGGSVKFSAREEGERVVVDIADTGVGFAPTTQGGVGLANLRGRLKLLYGGNAGLEVSEVSPAGTRVRVSLPR